MGVNKKLTRNVVSNWAGSLASILIAFFLSPFVIHHLGNTAYGIWVLMLSTTGYLGLLDLGIRGAVTYYVAKFHAEERHQEASKLVSFALVIFTFLGAIAIGISVFLGFIVSKRFHLQDGGGANLQLLIFLVGISVACTLINSVFGALVSGLQRFDLSNTIEMCTGVLKALVTLIALGHGKGLLALAIIHVTFSAVTTATFAWTGLRLYPQLSLRYVVRDPENARLIFSFGSHLFLLYASTYLILYTDSVVIGAFLPVAMVTFFAIAGNLIANSRSLISGISWTLSPFASSLKAKGNHEEIKQAGVTLPRYATMLILPIVITFVLRGKTFIGLWMGPAYADPSSRVLQVLSLALFLSAGNQVATTMMIGINKHRPVALMNVVEGILNLALSIFLVRRMGIIGVAWGTAIPVFFTSFVFWPMYLREVFGINFSKYVFSTWIRPTLAAIPFALASFLVDRMWFAPSVWFFFMQVALTLPVALLAFWFLCLSNTERRFSQAIPVGS